MNTSNGVNGNGDRTFLSLFFFLFFSFFLGGLQYAELRPMRVQGICGVEEERLGRNQKRPAEWISAGSVAYRPPGGVKP